MSSRNRDEHFPESKRTVAHRRRRSHDTVALCPERRPRASRSEVRLRARSMWMLHGHREGRAGPIVRDAGADDERRGDHHARGPRDDREAASDPEGVHRRAGDAVRLLPERRDADGEGRARQESESHERAAPAGVEHRALPLRRAHADDEGITEVQRGGGRGLNGGDFLKWPSGFLSVAFSSVGSMRDLVFAQAPQPGRFDGPGTPQLDSWVAIDANGNVTAYTGKVELGHGLLTSQTQLVAEELCVPLSRVTLIQGDTAVSPDQGTTSGSQSHPVNFNEGALAQACATARDALLQMAAQRMGVPATILKVDDGVISGGGRASLTYAELVGGKKFNLALNPNAKRKPASEWKILGQPVQRLDIPALATGQFEFVHNVRVPGMLHGRVVRPPEVGATLVRIDESSVSAMPGFVKVVVKKNFVGVVAE